ncbi:FAD-binding oxidoreductase [Pseudorhodoferax sp.]|uniref:FAD-binding oxidoreductase n=1 Tax=Pseudorhodoferax sp. TaxID=1993553 RepID=UPI002DD66004|nr:FAD-binding oxidoreductase [Pseudorhodoferax sp.]
MISSSSGPVETRYLHDWTGTRYGTPVGLACPGDAAAVAALLAACHAQRQPVAVQGGRTGVSGGAAPGDGELVLSLERLDGIEAFDRHAGVIVAGAGVVLQTLQETVEAEGWCLPLDLASRGSCQIGGNVATNAGGSRVVKYGSMRQSVLGLEAVLADGSVLGPPNCLVKNNAGYALSALLVGSEGTLGVVTRAALRLVPLPAVRRTALLALQAGAALDAVLACLRRGLGDALSALEVMWPDFVDAARAARPELRALPPAFAGRRVLLVEGEGDDDVRLGERLEACIGRCIDNGLVADAVVSASARDAASLWALRESVGEIQAGIRPYVGFDLGIACAGHDDFVAAARQRLQQVLPQQRAFFFGHAGDDNLHALVGPCEQPGQRDAAEAALYELLAPLCTSITAEHGIGRKKLHHLARSRSAADMAAMRSLKRALDPHAILNRGRVFADE